MNTVLKLAAVTSVTALMLVAVVACGKTNDAKAGDEPGETTTTSAAATAMAKAKATAMAMGPTGSNASANASANANAKASCNMVTALGTCNEYKAGTTFTLEKSLCEGFHGTFAHAACSTQGQLGACVMSDGEVKRYYTGAIAGEHALTLDEAKSDCESDAVKGTFTKT